MAKEEERRREKLSSSESDYRRELYDLSRRFLEGERDREISGIMERVFQANPMEVHDENMYKRGGYHQSDRKNEFSESGKQIAMERGIPAYNRAMGIPIGQRQLEPYLIGGTDVLAEQDDTHHVNNPAIQQMLDDYKRTTIVNLDIAHRMLRTRAAKEVTPETIDLYLETLQHTMVGGAVAQEHMSEINPLLTKDSYGKVITGSEEIKDAIDRRYLIDINKQFHPGRAEVLNEAIGNDIWLVLRVPTIAIRMGDADCAKRWSAMQNTMAFISAYGLSGEHLVSDLAFSFKHARVLRLGEKMWYQRMRSPNEPGSWLDGLIVDTYQTERELPPIRYLTAAQTDEDLAEKLSSAAVNSGCIGALIDNSIWLGFYMSGGIGFSNTTSAASLTGILDGLQHEMIELVNRYYKGVRVVLPKWDTIKFIADTVVQYLMESYEKIPTLTEFHWGGAHRTSIAGAFAASSVGLMTGSSTAALRAGHYAISYCMKEGWLRTGWAGQEIQDHVGLPYLCSFRSEEGNLPELRGLNYPMQSFSAAHGAIRDAAVMSAMLGRGSVWASSPVMKAAFADPNLAFDFTNPRLTIAKGCIKEFMPEGERDPVLPPH